MSVVVGGAADVVVLEGQLRRIGFVRGRTLIEAALEDGGDRTVAMRAEGERALGGRATTASSPDR